MIPLITALGPVFGHLIDKAPEVLKALTGSREPAHAQKAVKAIRAVRSQKIANAIDRGRLKRSLGIVKNSLEPSVHDALVGLSNVPEVGGNSVVEETGGKINIIKSGDQGMTNNSLMKASMTVNRLPKADPFSDQAEDGVFITGQELLGSAVADVNGSQVGNCVALFFLNPRLWTNTRVALYSLLYQRYFFHKIELIYVPAVSYAVDGQLAMGVLENTFKPVPFGSGDAALTALSEINSAEMFMVSTPQTVTYKFHHRAEPLWLSSQYTSNVENTLVNQAQLWLADASGLTTGKNYGKIYIKYELSMYNSWVDRNATQQQLVPIYVGTFSPGIPYVAALNCPATDLPAHTEFSSKIPPSVAETFWMLFFEDDDPMIESVVWGSTYKAGTILYAKLIATAPPAWPTGSAISIGLYPTFYDMLNGTNTVYRLSNAGNLKHNAVFIPAVSLHDQISGRVGALSDFSYRAQVAQYKANEAREIAELATQCEPAPKPISQSVPEARPTQPVGNTWLGRFQQSMT